MMGAVALGVRTARRKTQRRMTVGNVQRRSVDQPERSDDPMGPRPIKQVDRDSAFSSRFCARELRPRKPRYATAHPDRSTPYGFHKEGVV